MADLAQCVADPTRVLDNSRMRLISSLRPREDRPTQPLTGIDGGRWVLHGDLEEHGGARVMPFREADAYHSETISWAIMSKSELQSMGWSTASHSTT